MEAVKRQKQELLPAEAGKIDTPRGCILYQFLLTGKTAAMAQIRHVYEFR
jgi:hypothetical protein